MALEHTSTAQSRMAGGARDFRQGMKDCLPTLPGYLSIGLAAGVIQTTAGLSLMEITLFCLLLYAGSAQFMAVGMLVSGSSIAGIVIGAFFVNLRYLLLSAALSPYFRHLTPLRNLFVGALVSDETFGVAISKASDGKPISERWMHGLNLTAYVFWWLANIAGAMLGQWIADPERFGLDFALPAMFISLLVLTILGRNQIRTDVIVASIAVIVAVGSFFFLSGSLAVIAATLIASTAGLAVERWK
ncbi:AzlC family ABC transporter permease [Paenibacillus xanthanilyticus]|uniref:AzlC family ABC transporter permease n=1 Tax=Paenibacillus xanthanilyticus TaxID=1783531 RepID=A0ABV8JVH5_9BACL